LKLVENYPKIPEAIDTPNARIARVAKPALLAAILPGLARRAELS
jgi:hypothetical protein